ncbi:hypothetical protein SK128_007563 [Halocaridina rubra]|uniref:Condensation domain-containing protein n=1 Tax=Halocaridina rubra TaxID=373956 RepID=A0AAN8XGG1_HALRR
MVLPPWMTARMLSTSALRFDAMSSDTLAVNESPLREKENRWLWKADPVVCLYQEANLHRTRISAGVLMLNSAKPLDFDLFKEAFRILKRKAMNFRVCLRSSGDEQWFCEYDPGYVDVRVLDMDTNYIEAMENSFREGFDSPDVPQWRVLLIPRSPDTPCAVPEIKEKYPYQYQYVIHPNHIFIDGTNTTLLMQAVVDILNDLISGKAVDETTQYGIFTNNDGLREHEVNLEAMFKNYPLRLNKVIRELPPKDKKLWLQQVFPPPIDAEPGTRHVKRLLDPAVLARFQKKSKAAGVTFNSSFVSLINAAIIDLLIEVGYVQDKYSISVNHLVNLRRYLRKTEEFIQGAYNYPLSHTTDVSSSLKDNFWENIKEFHKDLHARLKSGYLLEQKVAKKMTEPEISPKEYFKNPPPVIHDFGVSNIGDISAICPGTGEHVQITDIMSLNTVHHYIHMDLHSIISYRGRSRYSLSYATDYMSDEAANILADKIMSLFEDLSK